MMPLHPLLALRCRTRRLHGLRAILDPEQFGE
jgi:hypothetical protein